MKNAELNRMTKAALINECDHDVEQEHDPRAPWGYEAWRCKKCGHKFHIPKGEACSKCEQPTTADENEYGEFICEDCEQNEAEAAYERYCERFHDGGATEFRSLRDQQIEARKLK